MLQKFAVIALCIGCSIAASTGNVISGRPEVRSSSAPIAQSLPASTNAVNSDQGPGLEGSKSGETFVGPVTGVYGGYSGSQGQFPSSSNPYPAQPTAMNAYTVYSNNGPGPYPSNNEIFGVSSNGDLKLSAYFGPVFWGFVAGLALGIIVVWIISLFGGFEYLGTAIRGIGTDIKKSGTGKAKSLDLDHITSLVYAAMDKYNKWNVNVKENY